MSITELKESVIQKLEDVGEPVLKDVLELIKFETSTEVYKVNNLEMESIEKGLRQIANGEIITHEQVNEETAKWLKNSLVPASKRTEK